MSIYSTVVGGYDWYDGTLDGVPARAGHPGPLPEREPGLGRQDVLHMLYDTPGC